MGRRWGRVSAVIAALLMSSTACGSGMIARPGTAPLVPYDGPLIIPASTDRDLWEDPGAAGQIVDCEFPFWGSTSTNPYSGGEVGSTPDEALAEAYDDGNWSGLDKGLRVARTDDDRVLYVYQVDGRNLQAEIVHYGSAVEGTGAGPDGMAWWIESWARCDYAEYPSGVAEGHGGTVWTDVTGRRVPVYRIVSFVDRDCVPGMSFLDLGSDPYEQETSTRYGAHPAEDQEHYLTEPFREDVPLPPDAVDTGYQHDDDHLWLSPDRRRAFVGTRDRVDVWPRTIDFGCG